MSAKQLLTRLEKVRPTGASQWIACCPAHSDRQPSLALRELDDGRILLHCFAGCGVHDVVSALGLCLSDLFPPKKLESGTGRPERRPFPPTDILRCIASEALVVVASAKCLPAGSLSEFDNKRLMLAVSRIQQAMDAGGIGHVK
jgi:hypothetical protein